MIRDMLNWLHEVEKEADNLTGLIDDPDSDREDLIDSIITLLDTIGAVR